MEWSETDSLRLIDMYKDCPVLWNPSDKEYYNQNRKMNAWRDIATKIERPAIECKKKIISLMSSYRRENSRMRNSKETGGGTSNTYSSRWFAYEAFQFLKGRDKSREILDMCLPASRATNAAENPANDSANVSSTVATTVLTSGTPAVPLKRVRLDDTNTVFTQVNKELQPQQTDEFEIFGIHVASQLRLLSLEQSIIAQEQIQSVLTRCRLQDLRTSSE